MLFYSLLASKVLNEKSVINLIENPLYKTVASLLLISKFLLFWFQQFDYSVSQCGFLSLSWLEFTELLGCAYSCLHQIWEVCFFKYFFLPLLSFWDSGDSCIGTLDGATSLSGSVHLFFFFPFYSSEWIVWIVFPSGLLILTLLPAQRFQQQIFPFSYSTFQF